MLMVLLHFYLCLILNVFQILITSILKVPPQITPFDFGEESFNEGDGVSAHCTVSKGDYPLNITWTFNQRAIKQNYGIVITRNSKRSSTLTIDSVSHSHIGNYTCTALNKAGSLMHTAGLSVNGTFRILFLYRYLLNIYFTFA